MDEISLTEYYDRFKNNEDIVLNNNIRAKALIIALDTRKFEIELYWKRATYFWAFIAAMFISYFAVLNSDKIGDIKGVTILISVLGYFFSLGWYFVNRGSKYWQENWETHVDLLGSPIQGHLFTTINISNQDFWKLNESYPFSVSRVNQFLSLLMVTTWLGLFIFSILFSFDKLIYLESYFWYFSSVLITFLILLTALFFNKSKSFIKRKKNIERELKFHIK